jgi:hypothetical protein
MLRFLLNKIMDCLQKIKNFDGVPQDGRHGYAFGRPRSSGGSSTAMGIIAALYTTLSSGL